MTEDNGTLLCCLRQCGDGAALLKVHVQPKASRNAVCGLHGDALKVAIQAPPVDGKANDSLVKYLAGVFGVTKRDVQLHSGQTSRQKYFKIMGKPYPQLVLVLKSLL